MKNKVIIILFITVGILSFLVYKQNKSSSSLTGSNIAISESTSSNARTLDYSKRNLAEVPKNILNNETVIVLNLSGNKLTGSMPAEIRMLKNLELLNASNNKMTGIPAEIGQLSKLKTVNFANNDISGLPLEMGNLKNLEFLDLRGNQNVSKYDISLIQAKLPNTKILTDQ